MNREDFAALHSGEDTYALLARFVPYFPEHALECMRSTKIDVLVQQESPQHTSALNP